MGFLSFLDCVLYFWTYENSKAPLCLTGSQIITTDRKLATSDSILQTKSQIRCTLWQSNMASWKISYKWRYFNRKIDISMVHGFQHAMLTPEGIMHITSYNIHLLTGRWELPASLTMPAAAGLARRPCWCFLLGCPGSALGPYHDPRPPAMKGIYDASRFKLVK